ncbi:MAG: hypothetical protein ACM3ZA_11010 [Bacillota bacterium]
MLVTTDTSLALRCARCGRLDVHPLSLFAFSGNHSVRLTCSCGAHKLTVGQRGGQFYLQFPCFLCDQTHFLYFPRTAFWAPGLKQITCPETGLDLGFFGAERPMGQTLSDALGALGEGTSGEGSGVDGAHPSAAEARAQALVEEAGFDEYFDNPQVMYELLNGLHEMASQGTLHCACGNPDVQVEVLPDRVELTCPACGRWRPLVAESDQDLDELDNLKRHPAAEQGWRAPRGGAPVWSH